MSLPTMQQTRLLQVYAVAFLANVCVFSVLYVLIPGLRESFIEEGTLLENLTAILAFNGFWVGLFLLLKRKHQPHPKLYALLPALSLILFLDELSFGEDIFGFEFMTLGGMQIDSLHDFVSLFYKKAIIPVGGRGPLWYALASMIAVTGLVLLLMFASRHRHRLNRVDLLRDLKRLNQTYPPLIFVAIAVGLGALAMTVDLRILQFKGAKFLEELFEMNGALALLLACFAIKITPAAKKAAMFTGAQSAQPLVQPLVQPPSRTTSRK